MMVMVKLIFLRTLAVIALLIQPNGWKLLLQDLLRIQRILHVRVPDTFGVQRITNVIHLQVAVLPQQPRHVAVRLLRAIVTMPRVVAPQVSIGIQAHVTVPLKPLEEERRTLLQVRIPQIFLAQAQDITGAQPIISAIQAVVDALRLQEVEQRVVVPLNARMV